MNRDKQSARVVVSRDNDEDEHSPSFDVVAPEVGQQCVRFANSLSRRMGRQETAALCAHMAIVQAILGGMSRERFEQVCAHLWQASEVDLAVSEGIGLVVMVKGGQA